VRPLLGSALLVAVALGLAGCGGGAKGPPPAQIVAAATKATAAEKSFHFVYDEQHGPPAKTGLHLIYANGDVVLPGNVKADVSGTLLGLPLRSTLVVVDGRYYIRNPFTQVWQKVSVATNPVAFFNPAKGVLAVIAGATQVKSAGSERVGGQDAYHVKGKVPVSAISPILGNPPSSKLVHVDLWIDKQSSRLLRVRISGPVESGDPSNAVRTVDLSNYGNAVVIKPPVVP
jgi:predicted small lipoprotein YifL